MTGMFRSLSVFNFRVWFIGALISNIGTWMQTTAQNWVVLVDLTDQDAGAVGITIALQFAPPMLLVPITGWVTDRFNRRWLLMMTQSSMMVLGLATGLLIISGVAELWHIYVSAALLGIISAFDGPARQAFVSDVVQRESASNAVALNSASFNAARMVGPAVAGLLVVVVGSGWVFIINATTFLAMIIALLMIRSHELNPWSRPATRNRIADGFRYVGSRPDFIVLFALVFLVGGFAMNFPIYASTMALEFGQEADGFGVLTSILAIGSLAGSLYVARSKHIRAETAVLAAGMYAVAALLSSIMPSYWLYASALMLTGFAAATLFTTTNGLIQATSAPEVRGRVLALYLAILMAGTPAGAIFVGMVANGWGPRWAIAVGGVLSLVTFLAALVWMFRMRRSRSKRYDLSGAPTLDADSNRVEGITAP